MATTTRARISIVTENCGSLWTFSPITRRANRWLRRHCEAESFNPMVVEHRYGFDIAVALLDAGFVLQDAATGQMARR